MLWIHKFIIELPCDLKMLQHSNQCCTNATFTGIRVQGSKGSRVQGEKWRVRGVQGSRVQGFPDKSGSPLRTEKSQTVRKAQGLRVRLTFFCGILFSFFPPIIDSGTHFARNRDSGSSWVKLPEMNSPRNPGQAGQAGQASGMTIKADSETSSEWRQSQILKRVQDDGSFGSG